MSAPAVMAVLVPTSAGNARFVVQCPFCGETHSHGFGGGYGYRLSHCTSGAQNYKLEPRCDSAN